MSNATSTAGLQTCTTDGATMEVMPFEHFFLGALLAEGIISEDLFSYAIDRLNQEKSKEQEELEL